MKQLLFCTAALFISITSSAQQCAQSKSRILTGQVGQLVLSAMKKAGADANCDQNICKFTLTNFEASEETDGCGGGTTGYKTSFSYADQKKYAIDYCTGSMNPEKDSDDVSQNLVEVLNDLGLSKTAGWRSTVKLSKIECVTRSTARQTSGAFANCQITE